MNPPSGRADFPILREAVINAKRKDPVDVSEDLRYQDLATYDPEVHAAIVDELARQRDTLEMIASENFVPRSVLQAQGSVARQRMSTRRISEDGIRRTA